MKYIITESQKIRGIIKYLNSEYGDLEPYETDEHPNYIFFMKNGKVIFDYNKKNGMVHISYNKIWSVLESFFGLGFWEIRAIIKNWVEEHYKLDVETIHFLGKDSVPWWKDITN
jgi:hypothetical protein